MIISSTGGLIVLVVLMSVLAAGPGFYALLRQNQRVPVEYGDMVTAQANSRERIRELERLREEDRALIVLLQGQMEELRLWVRTYIAQLEQAGLTPAGKPAHTLMNGKRSAELRRIIHRHFNREEMDDLLFRLGVNPEDVVGESGLTRAMQIVMYAERNELTEQLAELVDELRPNLKGEV